MSDVVEIEVAVLASWLQLERVLRPIGLLSILLILGATVGGDINPLVGGALALLLTFSITFGLQWMRNRIVADFRRTHGLKQCIARPISKPGPFSGKNRPGVFAIAVTRIAIALFLVGGLVALGIAGLAAEGSLGSLATDSTGADVVAARLGRQVALSLGLLAIGLWVIVDSKLRRKMHSLAAYQFPELPTGDNRPPVLLLRSFTDDESLVVKGKWGWRQFLPKVKFIRFEEVLARSIWIEGPVISIGQPDDKEPPPGAIRHYAGEGDWHPKVEAHIAGCARAYIIVGTTNALAWEFAQVLRLQRQNAVSLVLPPVEDLGVVNRWYDCRDAFGARELWPALSTEQILRTLLIRFLDDGRVLTFSGRKRNEANYEAAFLIARQT
jgi:hypothetical protein